MRGSGIYAEDWSGEMDCDTCEKTFEVDGQTNDWGDTAYATCPECGGELSKDISEDNEPDPDAMYEAWRDSQLDY